MSSYSTIADLEVYINYLITISLLKLKVVVVQTRSSKYAWYNCVYWKTNTEPRLKKYADTPGTRTGVGTRTGAGMRIGTRLMSRSSSLLLTFCALLDPKWE